MKRLLLATGIVILTFVVGIFALGVAQRDSRDRPAPIPDTKPDYSMQIAEPLAQISAPEFPANINERDTRKSGLYQLPPPLSSDPIVRANDAGVTLASEWVGETQSSPMNTPSPLEPPLLTPRRPNTNATPTPLNFPRSSQSIGTDASAVNAQPGFASPNPAPLSSNSAATPPSFGQSQPTLEPSAAFPAQSSSPLGQTAPGFGNSPAGLPPAGLAPPRFPPGNSAPIASDSQLRQTAVPSESNGLSAGGSSRLVPIQTNPVRAIPASAQLTNRDEQSIGNGPTIGGMAAVGSVPARLASNTPGQRQLEGSQNPSIHLQKRAPEEIQVGQNAIFTLIVRNVGNATAHEVVVNDHVPRGTEYVSTNPPANVSNGQIVWSLGEIAAGGEQALTLELIPRSEGEIGSVATVSFAAQASVRTVSTQPLLDVKQRIAPTVLIGGEVAIEITVTNNGSGVAKGVTLEEAVPAGLRSTIGNVIGTQPIDIAPTQSRTWKLPLIAAEPGKIRNVLRVVSLNAPPIESAEIVEVIAPQLKMDIIGPSLRYLESPATYRISVANTGTATARNLDIIANLPAGLRFNSAGNKGEYIAKEHAVGWGLDELVVGATATTELTVMPVREGAFSIRLQAKGDNDLRAEPIDRPVRIEGRSELAFSVEDDNDPVEINGQTTYTVRISNKGTRSDRDVQVKVTLPPGAQVLQVNAPVEYRVSDNRATDSLLEFAPVPEMRAQDEQIFRFSIRQTLEGTHKIRVSVSSQLRPSLVTKEEGTQVYSDR